MLTPLAYGHGYAAEVIASKDPQSLTPLAYGYRTATARRLRAAAARSIGGGCGGHSLSSAAAAPRGGLSRRSAAAAPRGGWGRGSAEAARSP